MTDYDSMPLEDYEYAIASQIAYDYYDNGNDAGKTQEILDTYLEGYTFDPQNSYNDASTIVRPDNSAILAYRGTRPTNFIDLNFSGENKTRVYRTNTFDLVSISTHAYKDYDDIRIIPQTDDQSSWLGSHGLNNFLPSLDMLPLSSAQEIFIAPTILKEEKREEEIIKKNIEDVCQTDPYLFPEKCRLPKLKKLKLKKK